ncbi:hypothetical protein DL95DRAFT_45919 [Leptodontidium sp. 2 PMI_412]|nr:hypothetical protein DL95DRAFT_45919 [Leptodontidium sp. 2 PMI_412]
MANLRWPLTYLPIRAELTLLAGYWLLLLLGALFSLLLSPLPSSDMGLSRAPSSYFADKHNPFNTLFVKRGWAWITVKG